MLLSSVLFELLVPDVHVCWSHVHWKKLNVKKKRGVEDRGGRKEIQATECSVCTMLGGGLSAFLYFVLFFLWLTIGQFDLSLSATWCQEEHLWQLRWVKACSPICFSRSAAITAQELLVLWPGLAPLPSAAELLQPPCDQEGTSLLMFQEQFKKLGERRFRSQNKARVRDQGISHGTHQKAHSAWS